MMLQKIWVGFIRQVRVLAVLTTVTVVAGAGWSYLGGGASDGLETIAASDTRQQPASPAWGDEVLASIHEHVLAGLPVRVANACGLGASSCFRCHNGKRAPAPGKDADKDPWHVQHERVNYSCAGCHKGNPRLMKETIAHNGLVANPVAEPKETCFGCHNSADEQQLVDSYRKLTKATGE